MSGSANFAKSNINSNYASVTEQSGIKAGDGGFQVDVKGNVDLKGGAITSTQAAIENNKNTFTKGGTLTTSDIQNQASYEAKSVSVSVGTGSGGMNIPGQGLSAALTGAGMGKDKGSASSTTTAGISGVAGDTSKRTGDNAQGIGKIFDADKVRQEIQAQTKITQEFGKQASTAIASYTQEQRTGLQDQVKKAATPEEKAKIEQAIKDVNLQEKVLNILVGAVTGLGATAVTKESLAAAADEMRTLMVADSKKFAGVVDKDGKKLFSNISGESVGVNGSGEKIAGSRANLDLLCGADNSRCDVPKKSDGSIDTEKPVKFKGNYEEFLKSDEGKKMMSAPFGGLQGGERTLFGEVYAKGSWQDKLLEAFAGPHDTIGGKLPGLYDKQGNIKQGMNSVESTGHEVVSGFALIPSSFFAAAQSFSPQVWNAISILLKEAR
jgi:filamentous hemagglutinin